MMAHLEGYTFDHIADPASSPHEYLSAVYEGDERQSPTESRFWSFCSSLHRAFGLSRFAVADLDYLPLPNRHARKRGARREIRRCRRSYVLRCLRKFALALPVLILSMFGVVHLLQYMVGRSHLFWNRIRFPSELDAPSTSYGEAFQTTAQPAQDVVPIPCHSHNDYWRREPLFDALRWGCTGVEVDVWLFDEELYVGHTMSSLKRERTFRGLYVDKLVEFLDQRNDIQGSLNNETTTHNGVFSSKPEQALTLLVDLKNSGSEAFSVVQKQLEPLRERGYLTYWNGEEVVQRAITVVGAGETSLFNIESAGAHRDIFLDAPLQALWEPPREPIGRNDPLTDLNRKMDYGQAMSLEPAAFDGADHFNTDTSYYASANFGSAVGFVWRGHLSPRQMKIIRGHIRGAKRRGLKARYFNTPSWPIALRNHVWHVLIKEGVDILSVDDLGAAAKQSWTTVGEQGLW